MVLLASVTTVTAFELMVVYLPLLAIERQIDTHAILVALLGDVRSVVLDHHPRVLRQTCDDRRADAVDGLKHDGGRRRLCHHGPRLRCSLAADVFPRRSCCDGVGLGIAATLDIFPGGGDAWRRLMPAPWRLSSVADREPDRPE